MPWIECTMVDVSEEGACIEVVALVVPDIFGLAFTARGEVLLVCLQVWRSGERVGRPVPECQGAQRRNHAGRR
jgi:hypothetical protein